MISIWVSSQNASKELNLKINENEIEIPKETYISRKKTSNNLWIENSKI